MAKRLTAIAVANARAEAVRYELVDGSTGLRLCVQPSGAKSWIVRYRRPPPDGRTAKLTHDRFVPLAEARKWAAGAMAELAQGRDPGISKAAARAAERQAATERAADTVGQWAATFIERHAKKKSEVHWRQAVHVFDDIALPAWRGRIVHDIKRRDIIELIESVAEDRPVMANRVHAHLSKFFNWLCERDVIAASPCAGVKHPAEEHARDRILSDDEVKRLWSACDSIGDPAGACVKVLLLTGQRRSEVAGMKRSEISGDVWTLPSERVKNKQGHDVPLSTQVLAIINAMPEIGDGGFIFTSTGQAPLGHFNRTKGFIDAHMKPVVPFVLHDLRRSCASHMARLGVRLPVIEKCLNHSSGSFRGIVGVYQRHDFAAEKREALQRWADHVDALVRGEPAGKVVKARFGRSA